MFRRTLDQVIFYEENSNQKQKTAMMATRIGFFTFYKLGWSNNVDSTPWRINNWTNYIILPPPGFQQQLSKLYCFVFFHLHDSNNNWTNYIVFFSTSRIPTIIEKIILFNSHLHDSNLWSKAKGEKHAEEKTRPDRSPRDLWKLDIRKQFPSAGTL